MEPVSFRLDLLPLLVMTLMWANLYNNRQLTIFGTYNQQNMPFTDITSLRYFYSSDRIYHHLLSKHIGLHNKRWLEMVCKVYFLSNKSSYIEGSNLGSVSSHYPGNIFYEKHCRKEKIWSSKRICQNNVQSGLVCKHNTERWMLMAVILGCEVCCVLSSSEKEERRITRKSWAIGNK